MDDFTPTVTIAWRGPGHYVPILPDVWVLLGACTSPISPEDRFIPAGDGFDMNPVIEGTRFAGPFQLLGLYVGDPEEVA